MDAVFKCSSYNIDSLDTLVNPANGSFSIIHFNIRSIRKNFSNMCAFLSSLPIKFDVICLGETFLYESEHTYFPIPNFDFVASSRDSRNGGVAIYVLDSIKSEKRTVSLNGAEAVTVRLSGVGKKPLQITCIYRSPASDLVAYLASLNSYLSAQNSNLDHALIGDMNINWFTQVSEDYKDIISSYNFQNVIDIPTRITNFTKTCIDHILVNFTENNILAGTICTDISDHFPVFAIFENRKQENFSSLHKERFRNLSKIDLNKLERCFEDIDWESEVFTITDVNKAYNNFIKCILVVLNKVSPLMDKKFNLKQYKNPWFKNNIGKAIKKKNRIFRQHKSFPFSPKLKAEYIKQRNYVSKLIKKAKTDYYTNVIEGESNRSKLWDIINKATGRRGKKPECLAKVVDSDGNQISDHLSIANYLNRYFTSIGPKLAGKIRTVPDVPLSSNTINCGTPQPENFSIATIVEELVCKEIALIKDNKASGVDGIPAKFIKASHKFLTKPLTHIINLSIKTCAVPDAMKIARVTPVFKGKGSMEECTNYRPISILPIFSKILEKVVNFQLMKYLTDNNVINTRQYGFQPNKGTNDALVQLSQQSFEALNKKHLILGIFIDFSKAFDTINHDILTTKMKNLYNFNTSTITWFQNYLSNRKQCVQINNTTSSLHGISCGVPQGSILGPTLFILYINDLITHVKLFNLILYADDTNLFFDTSNLNENINNINLELTNIANWCDANKLTLNLQKTNYMLIKNYQNKAIISMPLKIRHIEIDRVSSMKFLGVHIDEHLKWNVHIEKLRLELRKVTGLFYNASHFLPFSCLILLYNSLINSKIIYCIEAWGNTAKVHKEKILKIQKRLVRMLFKKPQNEHSPPLFKKARILPIEELYQLRILLIAHDQFYKYVKKSTPKYYTRQSQHDLPLPPSTSASGHRQVLYQASEFWNRLPKNIREIEKKNKTKVKEHLLALL